MKTKLSIQEKREKLKELSKGLGILKKEGKIETVNEGLKAIYAEEGHTDLKTLRQWNNEGKRVKKGEEALLLWGKPTRQEKQEEAEESEENMYDFYPICHVFSNLQIA